MGGFAEYEKTMIVAKLSASREWIKLKTGKRQTLKQVADQLNREHITPLDGKL